jgi:hypothetical protein
MQYHLVSAKEMGFSDFKLPDIRAILLQLKVQIKD